jgi:glycosyltransferase involved in cell wall biosynthesis
MGLPDDVVAIGIVGRLVAWKGQDEFLRAAAIVAGRRNDVHFFVVGEQVTDRYTAAHMGDERQRLEQLADQLEVRERVTFTGWCRDVPSMMAGLDLLVLASHAEPFGLVLLEAMSQGTAVIATTGGGPEDVVTHDTGVLVPPRNPEALAAALMRTVANPRLRRKMGQAARKRVRANFCLENEAVGILATWTRALHHARQSVCVSA